MSSWKERLLSRHGYNVDGSKKAHSRNLNMLEGAKNIYASLRCTAAYKGARFLDFLSRGRRRAVIKLAPFDQASKNALFRLKIFC